jgi:hypothetical protein
MSRIAPQKNPWFLALLTLYTLVELSFNHRLLEFAGQAFDRDDLDGLEFWGRCISGCGLGLLLWRWLDRLTPSRWLSGMLSLVIGISVMWQVQIRLIDFLLQQATELDKVTSVQRLSMRDIVSEGGFTLKGLSLGRVGMPEALRDSVKALFPAASLGVDALELDKQWMTPSASSAPVFDVEEAQQMLNDAYRQTVMLPIALGVSLFFALLNLSQALSLLLMHAFRHSRARRWLWRGQPFIGGGLALLLVSLTWFAGNDWVDSPGHREILQPALESEKPVLALFVHWSLHAEPYWHDWAWFSRHHLLQGVTFRTPWTPQHH